jgi:hypothetical protein
MNWEDAITILADRERSHEERYDASLAVARHLDPAGYPAEGADDWAYEGDWDGSETLDKMKAEWEAFNNQ